MDRGGNGLMSELNIPSRFMVAPVPQGGREGNKKQANLCFCFKNISGFVLYF